jgi:hypothetical protein
MGEAPDGSWGAWTGVAAWAGTFGLLLIVTRADLLGAVPGFVLAFAATAGVVLAAAAGRALAPPRPRVAAAAVVAGAGTAALTLYGGLPDAPAALVAGLGLLLAGTWLGVALGVRVARPSYVWPLVIVAMGADTWSVLSPEGVTHQVVEGGGTAALQVLTLNVPVPGVGVTGVLGVGDIAFAAFLVGAVRALGLPVGRLCAGLAAGFAACLVALLVEQVPLPALPFLGLGGAIALGGAVRPVAREVLLALGVVAVLFVLGLGVRATL